MTLKSVTIEQFIKAPIQKVWLRITTPAGIATWWRPGEIAAVVGHDFTMDMGQWGAVPCKVIEVDPGRRIAYTFADFTFVWTLREAPGGTVLTLEHQGIDLSNPQHVFAHANMVPGWRDVVLPRLAVQCEGETVA